MASRLTFACNSRLDSSNYPRIADMMADWYGKTGIMVTPEAVDVDSLIAAETPRATTT